MPGNGAPLVARGWDVVVPEEAGQDYRRRRPRRAVSRGVIGEVRGHQKRGPSWICHRVVVPVRIPRSIAVIGRQNS